MNECKMKPALLGLLQYTLSWGESLKKTVENGHDAAHNNENNNVGEQLQQRVMLSMCTVKLTVHADRSIAQC